MAACDVSSAFMIATTPDVCTVPATAQERQLGDHAASLHASVRIVRTRREEIHVRCEIVPSLTPVTRECRTHGGHVAWPNRGAAVFTYEDLRAETSRSPMSSVSSASGAGTSLATLSGRIPALYLAHMRDLEHVLLVRETAAPRRRACSISRA